MKNDYTNLTDQYSGKEAGYYGMQRPEMLQFIPLDAKSVLEVGCSAGAFGSLLKASRPGIEVWGVEPNESAADLAAQRLDRVIPSDFGDGVPELNGKKFDCVVFNDVLEHLVDPAAALQIAKRYLKHRGTAVASIPNILHFYQIWEILVQQDWQYRSAGILDETHLRFFTKKSIVRLFAEAGYEIDLIEGINRRIGRKYQLINALTFGRIRDWQFVQFGIRAVVGE